MRFAIVDLETTGGTPSDSRIMEIGIVLMDGVKVVDTFQSLVDPGQDIPPFIQNLTGIKPEMVSGKPQFSSIAEHVAELLQDRIFVAHNVLFDCKFMRAELKRCAIAYDPARLCTVKMSRHVFPGFPSYSLHKLTESLGLADFNHHRALDDAMAAAEILKLAISKVGEKGIRKEIKNIVKASDLSLAECD